MGSGGKPISKMAVKRKRSRSGCLPCRNRRRKCDGARPQCRNCESKGYICQWGLKVSFHPSRNFCLSHWETAALTAFEERQNHSSRWRRARDVPTIIDETEGIVQSYNTLDNAQSPYMSDSDPFRLREGVEDDDDDDNEEEPITHDASALTFSGSGDFGLESDSGKSDSGLHAHESTQQQADGIADTEPHIDDLLSRQAVETPAGPSWDLAPPLPEPTRPRTFSGPIVLDTSKYAPPFFLGQAITNDISLPPEPSLPVSNAEKVRLICSYMQETGTWCETTDSDMHFTMRSTHEVMKSAAFTAAAMSLASRQLDHVEHRQRPITLELYQYTVQLLLRQDPAKADASLLATCTLLCVYEMMASGVHEWRRHLKGCASLLQAKKWNGSSQGIVKACFWAFARIDVWAAFISGKTTLIPTDFWVDDMSIESVMTKGNVDDYCNLAILIFAQIVNLIHTDKGYRPALATSVSSLWDELQKWYQLRPQEVCPLLRDSSASSKVFPTIVYTHASSICGNTFYHTGSVLLLQTGLLQIPAENSSSLLEDADNAFWHARELAGISMSNSSHANWVNHLQPLYIAGTVFAGNRTAPGPEEAGSDISSERRPYTSSALNDMGPDEEEYAAEKILLLKQLARIERETGWKTTDRAAALRMLWEFG